MKPLLIILALVLCGTAWADLIKCPDGYKQSYLSGGQTECIPPEAWAEDIKSITLTNVDVHASKSSLYRAKCEEYLVFMESRLTVNGLPEDEEGLERAVRWAQIATAYCTAARLE